MGRNKNTLEWGWGTWWPNNDALWPRSLRWRSPFFVRGPLLWKKSGDVKLDRQVYQTKLSRFFKSRGPSPSSWIREIGSFAGGKFYWQFLQVTNSVTRACLFLDIRLNPNGVFQCYSVANAIVFTTSHYPHVTATERVCLLRPTVRPKQKWNFTNYLR